jgi:hypothetical protein
VSYVADPATGIAVYSSKAGRNGAWVTLGGTSVGASQWAAILALGAHLTGDTSSASSVEALYNIATHSYGNNYHDITTGASKEYPTAVGYDLVTGLGSPIANILVLALEKE